MNNGLKYKTWQIVASKQTNANVIDTILVNRGIKTTKEKEEFTNPIQPDGLTLKDLGITPNAMKKAVTRVKKAIKEKEKVIVYGDYDADGVCATGILWEALYAVGADALPYIPERFTEGYGINFESAVKLKGQYPNLKLVVTVDNGIVAVDAVKKIKKLGIDVIISDHHLPEKKLPSAFAIVHTTLIGGAAVAWVLAREIKKEIDSKSNTKLDNALELAGIGTIADQLPLLGANRSFAKYGLEKLRTTKRPGLIALAQESGFDISKSGGYEVGFLIAPRINAMGRLEHAIESLRLVCTKDRNKAATLAQLVGKTNLERQRVVDEVVIQTRKAVVGKEMGNSIILASETYHEGVIGLAAGKLVGEFYRPAIVISMGEKYAKASARSIPGFNIIEAIRKLDNLIEGGGGHPMAAGFTILNDRISEFKVEFEKIAGELIDEEMKSKKLKIDMEIDLDQVNQKLSDDISNFEPTGLDNPVPVFFTKDVEIAESRYVGRDNKHLKLKLKKGDSFIDAIAFGFGEYYQQLSDDTKVDLAYAVEENVWNGSKSIQLKVIDLSIHP